MQQNNTNSNTVGKPSRTLLLSTALQSPVTVTYVLRNTCILPKFISQKMLFVMKSVVTINTKWLSVKRHYDRACGLCLIYVSMRSIIVQDVLTITASVITTKRAVTPKHIDSGCHMFSISSWNIVQFTTEVNADETNDVLFSIFRLLCNSTRIIHLVSY